jgi:hypothetical protein
VSAPVVEALPDVSVVTLEGAGHVPLTDPGLEQLEESVVAFIGRCLD